MWKGLYQFELGLGLKINLPLKFASDMLRLVSNSEVKCSHKYSSTLRTRKAERIALPHSADQKIKMFGQ